MNNEIRIKVKKKFKNEVKTNKTKLMEERGKESLPYSFCFFHQFIYTLIIPLVPRDEGDRRSYALQQFFGTYLTSHLRNLIK